LLLFLVLDNFPSEKMVRRGKSKSFEEKKGKALFCSKSLAVQMIEIYINQQVTFALHGEGTENDGSGPPRRVKQKKLLVLDNFACFCLKNRQKRPFLCAVFAVKQEKNDQRY